MPARDTLLHFQKHLQLQYQWDLSGSHYQKTAEAWLNNMDNNSQEVMELFTETYGRKEANVWVQRWRIFFMSCAELFGYSKGNEWLVAHYLFSKQS
jgi:cyclopropane-fatty-acyl-phospholipid synthase